MDSLLTDSRGVRRGKCKACSCVGYDGGEAKRKCVRCAHPPGQHINLDNQPTTSGSFGAPSGSHIGGGPHSGGHGYSTQYSQHGASPGHPASAYQVPYYQQVHLPRCPADGCMSPVYYDQFGTFQYCSPACRDRHLLPINKALLEADLKELLKNIHARARIEPDIDHSSGQMPSPQPTRPTLGKNSHQQMSAKPLGRPDNNEQSSSSLTRRPLRNSNPSPTKASTEQDGKKLNPPTPDKSPQASPSMSSPQKVSAQFATCNYKDAFKKKKQNTVLIVIKECEELPGLLVSALPYSSQPGDPPVFGFLITGVIVQSKAYKKFTDDKLCFLDIITSINGKDISKSVTEGEEDLQLCFERLTKTASTVTLKVNHSVALSPTAKLLKKMKKNEERTHIVAMGPAQYYGQEDFGITLQNRLTHEASVYGLEKDSPSRVCGLAFDDEILACGVAHQDKVDDELVTTERGSDRVFKDELKSVFQKAAKDKKAVILSVKRCGGRVTSV